MCIKVRVRVYLMSLCHLSTTLGAAAGWVENDESSPVLFPCIFSIGFDSEGC